LAPTLNSDVLSQRDEEEAPLLPKNRPSVSGTLPGRQIRVGIKTGRMVGDKRADRKGENGRAKWLSGE
jgi:hypothetical protein